MEQPDVTKRGIGLNFTDTGQAGLVLWAPKLKKAEVLVNKGTKKLSLKKN